MSFPDLRKSRKWLSAEEIRLLAVLLLLIAGLLALNITLARILPGGEWFFLRWSGARSFLIEETQPPSKLRSEEHTSELQSLAYLVCRLLLEKKKKKIKIR